MSSYASKFLQMDDLSIGELEPSVQYVVPAYRFFGFPRHGCQETKVIELYKIYYNRGSHLTVAGIQVNFKKFRIFFLGNSRDIKI